jgi:hypothetical protein
MVNAIDTQFLGQEEVDDSGRRIVKLLGSSLDKRQRFKQMEEDDSDSDGEMDQFVKEEEDTLHTALSECLGAFFRTHPQQSLTIVNYFYT